MAMLAEDRPTSASLNSDSAPGRPGDGAAGSVAARLDTGPFAAASECLDEGVLAIDGCGSLFLFDLVHSRFQRLPRGTDRWRALRYGSWLPLRELVLDADGTFIVEPGAGGGPRLRSHTHGTGCGCTPMASI
ncbi:MAG: hypothetical protein JWL83_545 [Actinomycetia bacterium]|nr:hypothetical protein [Actinomycetes bacterium]